MKNWRMVFLEFAIHIVGWSLLFIVPYSSTYQVIQSVLPDPPLELFIPILIIGAMNISIFYLNYFVLIPRVLFRRKYIDYFLSLVTLVFLSVLFAQLVFYIIGLKQDHFESIHPMIARIRPIAFANTFLVLMVSILVSLVLGFSNQLKLKEKQRMEAQLTLLKTQINPHFLFNVLNSIYSVSLKTSPKASQMVEQLSSLLRYSLKEAHKDYVSLGKELEFIQNYIELQKLRHESVLEIELIIHGDTFNKKIAPMILMPFIENSFKHGVSDKKGSKIEILIVLEGYNFSFRVRNNKMEKNNSLESGTGIGIEHSRSRLELMYPNKHLLEIIETKEDFLVSLKLTID